MWLQSNTVNFPCLVWKRLFTKKNTRSKDWKTLTQDTGKRHLNCKVTSSDINRSRIHLRGGKRKKNAKPARFPCGALNARKFTVVSREPASFLSFSYFFLFLQLFLFASSSSPFLHLVPFLFFFFFLRKRKERQPVRPRGLIVARLRGEDQFVSRRNILGKWSGRPCKSLLVNFILRLLDPYAESAPRFTTTKSLTASTDPYRCSNFYIFIIFN